MQRREFLKSGASLAAFTIVPRYVLGGPGCTPPSERLNIAVVGAGGKGHSHVGAFAELEQNIVALCDVDQEHAAKSFENNPKARKYRDFRRMLERQKDIDAVVVATPDHTHAVAAMAAIQAGKHVYCEKPLAHSVHEVRKLVEAASAAGVATQMGNQRHAQEGIRILCEWIRDGAIGDVREVHAWTDRAGGRWPQGVGRPEDTPPVPDTLAWDLWLGPAPERPYNQLYHPFNWRGWFDFGTGALGDMGCHIIDSAFWALNLGLPTSVEAVTTEVNDQSFPVASIVNYQFKARGEMPPVKLTWYDGGLQPPRPEELEPGRKMGSDDGGLIFVGDKGKILCDAYCQSPRIIPEERMREYTRPPKSIPRSPGHREEWIAACKGGKSAGSNFDYAGPLTEMVLLGNVAVRARQKIYWDAANMKCTNLPGADQLIRRQYRQGWML